MANPVKIAPSILAADFVRLGEQVRDAESGGADLLHIDVMDGHFVPNITFGPLIVQAVRSVTKLPLDIHLMIEKPERYIPEFVRAGATMVNVHVETCPHLHRTLQQIKSLNAAAGVALNPHTPFEMIREILGDVNRVLVMTVNPGFGGQKLIHSTLPKVRQIAEAAAKYNHPIEIAVDGGIDAQTIAEVRSYGANVFVAGAAVFGHSDGVAAGIAALRKAVS
ncbi:MAG: ribulose-phosphate 3-epimerase [Anaerolineae bacterium]